MTFWDSFNKYIGVPGIIGTVLVVGIVAAFLMGVVVPPEVYGFAGVAVGYYFGNNGKPIIKQKMEDRNG